MSGRPRIRHAAACLAAVGALVLAATAAGAGPAAAAPLPIGQCTTSSGVILAVDFGHWGGPLLRSCGSTPTTGYTLLNQGGWQTTGTQHDGPAFICRIGYAGYRGGTQYPTANEQGCVLTPPTTAYWSHWYAGPGQTTWSYGQSGAMSSHPEPGSVDLWTFGATDLGSGQGWPPYSPDTVRAHNTTPTGGSGGTSTSGGASGGTSGGASASGGTTGGASASGGTSGGSAATGGSGTAGGTTASHRATPAAAATTTTPAAATPSAASPSASPSASSATAGATASQPSPPAPAGSESAQPRTQDAEPTAAAGHSSGSMLPAAITAAVVAVIAGLVVLRIRQRRRNAR